MSYTITSIMNGEFESSKALVNGHLIQEYQDESNGFILFLKTRRCRVSTPASPRYFFNAKAINLVQPKGILGSHVNPSEGLSLLLTFGGWKVWPSMSFCLLRLEKNSDFSWGRKIVLPDLSKPTLVCLIIGP